jgi:hypothetical protein
MKQAVNGCHPRLFFFAKGQTFIFSKANLKWFCSEYMTIKYGISSVAMFFEGIKWLV